MIRTVPVAAMTKTALVASHALVLAPVKLADKSIMIGQPQIDTLEGLKRSAIRWIASHGMGLPEAEDIFQQAILKAVSTPSEAEDPGRITSWFYQILRNTLIDEFRKTKADQKKVEEFSKEVLPRLDSETEADLCRCVLSLLSELPDSDRSVLEKHFFEGKKFKDLALESQQSESAVRVKALRARQKLKDSLQSCCNITRMDEAENCDC